MIIRLIPHVHPCVPDGQCKRCAYMCWWLHIVRVVWAGFPVWLEAIWYHIKGGLQTPRMTYICPNHIARWHQSRVFILTSLLQGKGLISQTSCPVLDEMRLHNIYVCSTPQPHTHTHPTTNPDPNPHSPPPLSCPFLGCFCYSAPFRNLSSVQNKISLSRSMHVANRQFIIESQNLQGEPHWFPHHHSDSVMILRIWQWGLGGRRWRRPKGNAGKLPGRDTTLVTVTSCSGHYHHRSKPSLL